jgi:hypothetical protein
MKSTLFTTLDELTKYVVAEVNRYIKDEFRIYGKTLQEIKATMNTADFTKLFQYIVNEVIESALKDLNIDGRREEVTGYDFVILGEKIEFKLMGGADKSSFATGNKTSHFGGAKTNLVWSIKYEFSDNQISSFGMVLIDTNRAQTNVWNSSEGRKDSFSTLKLTVAEEDCIVGSIGIVKAASKFLHFLPLPLEVAMV